MTKINKTIYLEFNFEREGERVLTINVENIIFIYALKIISLKRVIA